MTKTQRAAMRGALMALREAAQCVRHNYTPDRMGHDWDDQIDALEAALAEPEPEPVAWVRLEAWESGKEWPDDCFSALPADGFAPLYTTPPARRPLTLEEIMDAVRDADLDWHTGWSLGDDAPNRYITLIRAAERAHGITGDADE